MSYSDAVRGGVELLDPISGLNMAAAAVIHGDVEIDGDADFTGIRCGVCNGVVSGE